MALLRDYQYLGATKLKDFTQGVITGLSDDPAFSSLATQVTALTTLNDALADSILSFGESTSHTDDVMIANMGLVVKKLNEIRPLADTICNGDEGKERLSGFTPSKKVRSRRNFIGPVHIKSISSTSVPGQLVITLTASVPGNTGYEVHYVLDGKDYVVGTYKVRNRSLELVVGGFPSGKTISVYLITLSTNNLRSTPSNYVTAAAS